MRYSVEKAKKFINSLGLTVYNDYGTNRVKLPYRNDESGIDFSLDSFIMEMNNNDIDLFLVACTDLREEFKFLAHILINNRDKFKYNIEYNKGKVISFLSKHGYKIIHEDIVGKDDKVSMFKAGELDNVLDFANGKDCTLTDTEKMIYMLLKDNEEKVVDYVLA